MGPSRKLLAPSLAAIVVLFGTWIAGARAAEQSVVDVDGNTYAVVELDGQRWMAENLRVRHYRDGSPIPHVEDDAKWGGLTDGALCEPGEGPGAGREHYGLLYNAAAVFDERAVCPEGWHVPTAQEWKALIEAHGGGERAGAALKSAMPKAWPTSREGGGDSGFSALPAGGRGRVGGAGEAGRYATWWSSTPDDAEYTWHWGLHPDSAAIRFNPGHNASGFSIRCIED